LTLIPKTLGDIPVGLPEHHRKFLRSIKDALEILMGRVVAQSDVADNPGSQAVIFDDLSEGAAVVDEVEEISLINRINALEALTSNIISPELSDADGTVENIYAEMSMIKQSGEIVTESDVIDHIMALG
jgi:hypothetical protein